MISDPSSLGRAGIEPIVCKELLAIKKPTEAKLVSSDEKFWLSPRNERLQLSKGERNTYL